MSDNAPEFVGKVLSVVRLAECETSENVTIPPSVQWFHRVRSPDFDQNGGEARPQKEKQVATSHLVDLSYLQLDQKPGDRLFSTFSNVWKKAPPGN